MAAQLYTGGEIRQAPHDENLFSAYVFDQAKIERESRWLVTQTYIPLAYTLNRRRDKRPWGTHRAIQEMHSRWRLERPWQRWERPVEQETGW